PGPGLRRALEAPERVDALLAERIALPAADRLHLLAGHEPLGGELDFPAGTAVQLVQALRRRYSFIVADVPFRPLPLYRELLDLASQRVLVMEPTLASVRDVLRLLALPAGEAQPGRAIVVLNRAASSGGMSRRQVEQAIGISVDVAIPNLPRQISNAATLGEPAIARHAGFRGVIADLARQATPVRLIDNDAPAASAAPSGSLWRRLTRRAA
ncbi:MAG: AAA family ATPase, partial [Acetobacteraceae bacterium]